MDNFSYFTLSLNIQQVFILLGTDLSAGEKKYTKQARSLFLKAYILVGENEWKENWEPTCKSSYN